MTITLASFEFFLNMVGSVESDTESSSLEWKELVGEGLYRESSSEGLYRESSSDNVELSSLLLGQMAFLMESRVSTASLSPGLLHTGIDSVRRTILNC